MKPTPWAAWIAVLLLPALLAACQLVGAGQLATGTTSAAPGEMSCAGWLDATETERLALADRLVGGSADLLERIRVRQHRPDGTGRDVLIRDVVSSLTKNCEVWPPRDRTVQAVVDALYLGGRSP